MQGNTQLVDEVFNLFKRRGPLSVAQICVDLLLTPEEVIRQLKALQKEGAAILVAEDGVKRDPDDLLSVWKIPGIRDMLRRKE